MGRPKVNKDNNNSKENRNNFEKNIQELYKEIHVPNITWSFNKDEEIEYFDTRLSFEITGYRPINTTQGLDFRHEWFTETREIKKNTGKYCAYPPGTKAYANFWKEQYRRCRDGLTINGYTLTGHNYFFLNFYKLPNLTNIKKLGDGRVEDFPEFYVCQYEYFHYIELCRVLGYNAVGLKARGLGFSEIGASITTNSYTCRKNSRTVVAAQKDGYVTATLDKCWLQLNNLNQNTEGGFKKLRQKHNSYLFKKASNVDRGGNEYGWKSEIEGIIADKPNKIRGDRTDILLYEESGSWPDWKKAFIQGDALVFIQGIRFGIKLGWGTGGDSGPALEGLSSAYYNPNTYDVLPFRHNHTYDGEDVITAFFIPSYALVNTKECMDHRGYTDPVLGKDYYTKKRLMKSDDPKGLLIYSAEYCFTAEEALALEGENFFNTAGLAEQIANIKLHKNGPKVEVGHLEYKFSGEHTEENIIGFKFTEDYRGKVMIIEHPILSESGGKMDNLYVAGIDSIDMGEQDTSAQTRDPSQFCIVIKRRAFGLKEPAYVAMYKDRPNDIREAYKIALRLLEYYNCKAVLEASKITILTFFRERRKENKYLMRRPRATLTDVVGGISRQFGVPATETIIKHQLELVAKYVNDYYHNIWFIDMLEELVKYSYANKRKFDIVAAMGMLELGDEEMSDIFVKDNNASSEKWIDIGYHKDERGYRVKGRIPESGQPKLNINIQLEDGNRFSRTSRPDNYLQSL